MSNSQLSSLTDKGTVQTGPGVADTGNSGPATAESGPCCMDTGKAGPGKVQQTKHSEHSDTNNTKVQYGCYLTRWVCFCNRKTLIPFSSNVKPVKKNIASLHHSGLGYTAINTARSALSSFLYSGRYILDWAALFNQKASSAKIRNYLGFRSCIIIP